MHNILHNNCDNKLLWGHKDSQVTGIPVRRSSDCHTGMAALAPCDQAFLYIYMRVQNFHSLWYSWTRIHLLIALLEKYPVSLYNFWYLNWKKKKKFAEHD